jgi:hypothetical protein
LLNQVNGKKPLITCKCQLILLNDVVYNIPETYQEFEKSIKSILNESDNSGEISFTMVKSL